MNEIQQLRDFATNIQQEVFARCDAAEDGAMRSEKLTEVLLEYLVEAQEIDDGQSVSFEGRGIRCSGFFLSEDNDRLDLFLTIPQLDGSASTVAKGDVTKAFERLAAFLARCFEGLHKTKEEANDRFDMARSIWQSRNDLSMVRLFVLTDGVVNIDTLAPERIGELEVTHHLWDLRRFMRTAMSGKGHEPVTVDFAKLSDEPVRCIVAAPPEAGYRCMLTVIPGSMLVELYDRFGPRLLERNVRSFLQLKGGINQKIRKTILEDPELFLAFNNGLSVTASGVKLRVLGNGIAELLSAEDFQIVNGGQTTGSIFRAARKDKADLSAVSVQLKITEILPGGEADELAPDISRFANAQNKINMADFSSNNPFHRKVEMLSRTIWAPPGAGGGQRQTKWFYERARGQYNDDLGRNPTPAKRTEWSLLNPRRQLITKTDLAKFEQSWNQLPYVVSKGAEKCYLDFLDRLENRGQFVPDEGYFRRLVSLAILFKETDRIVARQKFGGYKANITTYTVALLSHLTAKQIDLDAIWTDQTLNDQLSDFLERLSAHVQDYIVSTAGTRNVSEWCKSEKCWDGLKEAPYALPAGIRSGRVAEDGPGGDPSAPTPEELDIIERVAEIKAQIWFALAAWAKDTQTLLPWQRSLSFSLGRLASSGKRPSLKQSNHGMKILDEARRLGFVGEAAEG